MELTWWGTAGFQVKTDDHIFDIPAIAAQTGCNETITI